MHATRQSLRRRFDHDAWANATLARALSEHPADSPTNGILAHTLAAEWLWLRRLGHDGPDVAVWPSWSPREADEQIDALTGAWRTVLERLDETELAREVSYENSLGQAWTNTVSDVLEHVLLHSSHHRGQIVASLRAAGVEPPYVDFIHAIRTGQLGP